MLANKILKVVLLLLGGIYVLLQGFALEVEGDAVASIAFVLLTGLYFCFTKHKSKLFLSFLVVFTIAQVISFMGWYAPILENGEMDYSYFVPNILLIVAYLLLIIKIGFQLNMKKVFLELTVPIIILVILDVFCVSLISSTTEGVFNYYEDALELIYNAVVMALLSFALINYLYRNNNKSMLFLIGSIFIVFSEIIQLAYFYILSNDNSLGYVYSFFLVVAFVFYYMQSQHVVSDPTPAYTDDPMEA
ncbi:hypothetical protein [Winogradskyella sp. PC D3.3]